MAEGQSLENQLPPDLATLYEVVLLDVAELCISGKGTLSEIRNKVVDVLESTGALDRKVARHVEEVELP